MSANTKVRRIAAWAGWCSPCASEDRPLVLTRTGPAGLRAWLAGHDDDDRVLLLTCNVCGHVQLVPPREEDDPEVVLAEDVVRPEQVPPVELDGALPATRAEASIVLPGTPTRTAVLVIAA